MLLLRASLLMLRRQVCGAPRSTCRALNIDSVRMVNELIEKLRGGDLRSDGRSNEVADAVIRKPHLIDKLVERLDADEDVVRARTAHALERISRTNPEMLQRRARAGSRKRWEESHSL